MKTQTRELHDWLAAHIAAGAPGQRLPPIPRLAAEWGLSAKTVHRLFREFQDRGLVCSVQGRGSFIGDVPPPPGPGPERQRSADTIVSTIIANIARGELKRGDPLLPNKIMNIQYGVAPATVTRAYRTLCDRGYAVKIGRCFYVGEFSTYRKQGPPRLVYVFDCCNDYHSMVRRPAQYLPVQEMESELLHYNCRVRHEPLDAWPAYRRTWNRTGNFPAGLVFANLTAHEQYTGLLPGLRTILARLPHQRPVVMLSGRHVRPLARGIEQYCTGTVPTAVSAVISRFAFDHRFDRVEIFFDDKRHLTTYGDLVRLWPQVTRLNPAARVRFHVTARPGFNDPAGFYRHLEQHINDAYVNYLVNISGKYRAVTRGQLLACTTVSDDLELTFRGLQQRALWIFPSEADAARAVLWCRRQRIDIPATVSVMGLQDDPAYGNLGITACVPDWHAVGYLMAHTILKDIPVEKTTQGYVRARARIFERATTP